MENDAPAINSLDNLLNWLNQDSTYQELEVDQAFSIFRSEILRSIPDWSFLARIFIKAYEMFDPSTQGAGISRFVTRSLSLVVVEAMDKKVPIDQLKLFFTLDLNRLPIEKNLIDPVIKKYFHSLKAGEQWDSMIDLLLFSIDYHGADPLAIINELEIAVNRARNETAVLRVNELVKRIQDEQESKRKKAQLEREEQARVEKERMEAEEFAEARRNEQIAAMPTLEQILDRLNAENKNKAVILERLVLSGFELEAKRNPASESSRSLNTWTKNIKPSVSNGGPIEFECKLRVDHTNKLKGITARVKFVFSWRNSYFNRQTKYLCDFYEVVTEQINYLTGKSDTLPMEYENTLPSGLFDEQDQKPTNSFVNGYEWNCSGGCLYTTFASPETDDAFITIKIYFCFDMDSVRANKSTLDSIDAEKYFGGSHFRPVYTSLKSSEYRLVEEVIMDLCPLSVR